MWTSKSKLSTPRQGRMRVFLLCASLAMTTLLWWQFGLSVDMKRFQPWCAAERQSEHVGITPEFPMVPIRFTKKPLLKAEPCPESDAAWRALTMGHSLIELNRSEAQAAGIGGGLPTVDPDMELYGVSWTHQLHCLVMIRQGFWDVYRQRHEFLDPSAPPESGAKARHLDHMQHCFDYLQQAILCAGDTTLEGRAEGEVGSRPRINGYGAVHQCRDMNTVGVWMKTHAAKSRPRLPPLGHETHGQGGYDS